MSDMTVVVPRWFRILIIGQVFFNAIMWIIFMFIIITANIRISNLEDRTNGIVNVDMKLHDSRLRQLEKNDPNK